MVAVTRKIDDDLFEELEDLMLQADLGVAATSRLIAELRSEAKRQRLNDAGQLKGLLRAKMGEILGGPGISEHQQPGSDDLPDGRSQRGRENNHHREAGLPFS